MASLSGTCTYEWVHANPEMVVDTLIWCQARANEEKAGVAIWWPEASSFRLQGVVAFPVKTRALRPAEDVTLGWHEPTAAGIGR